LLSAAAVEHALHVVCYARALATGNTYTLGVKSLMDKDERLQKILGQLSGGRLEEVADKLMALFRQPEWWEEEFDK